MKNDKIIGRPIRLNVQYLAPRIGKNYADVMFIGDVHLGSKQFDRKRFEDMINFCNLNNFYVVLMGDLLEMSTRDSVGSGVYEQEFIGQSQYEQMCEYLRPLAEKKLILGTYRGNHCERVYKSTGVDISKMIARELGIPYLGDACWNKFIIGNQSYSIYGLHGRTGAKFDGTALLNLERLSASFFADLVVVGHSHKCINSIVQMQYVKNGLIKEHKKHLLVTGSFLKFDGSYAQTFGLPISKLGSPRAKLFSDVKDIHITW